MINNRLLLTLAILCVVNCGGGGSDSNEPSAAVVPKVSGLVTVGDSMRTDSDINDPLAFYSSNDTMETAQRLPNPASVVGFVSRRGTGNPGDRFERDVDEADIYRLQLLEGQHLTLQVADFSAEQPQLNDIDLFLYDAAGQLVGVSDQVAEFESILVPETGDYYLMVEAFAGVGKYALHVGNDYSNGRAGGGGSSVDFIAHELILQTRDNAAMAARGQVATLALLADRAEIQLSSAHRNGARLSRIAGREGARRLLELLADRAGKPGFLGKPRKTSRTERGTLCEENGKYLILRLVKLLGQRSDAVLVEPNYRVYATGVPDDAYYYRQWNYPFIHLDQAWDITTGSNGEDRPVVAVVDSGVLLGHPDLAGQLIDGFDFISDPSMAADGDGIDANPDDVGDREGLSALSSFHGTHVAGTVAAATDNGNGVAGVSWGARIMPLRALGVGGGSSYDLVQAIRYAAGLPNDSGRLPARKADVINLSLGCSACYSQLLQDTVSAARSNGTIVVAAAGNEGHSVPFYPAAYDGVVAVGALNSGGTRAQYSNFGSYLDLVAPGGDSIDRNGDGYGDQILSTVGDDSSGSIDFRYGWSSGTSMAAPHVAGVAALMKTLYPALTPDDFDQSIASFAVVSDLGSPGWDEQYGYGVIDALKGVQYAQLLSGVPLTGVVTVSPSVLDFPVGHETAEFSIRPLGEGGPSVLGVRVDQSWLTVTPAEDVDQNGFGGYLVSVSRAGLGTAIHRGTISVDLSDGRSHSLSVYLQVVDVASGAGDAGQLYLLLVDDRTLGTAYQTGARYLGEGRYEFQFDQSVEDGIYRLYGGSDIDNDGVLCTAGETCGAYPTLDDIGLITIDRNRDGLNFKIITRADFAAQAEGAGSIGQTLLRRD